MATDRKAATYRLTEQARSLIVRLADQHGISQTAVVELAVRLLAKRDLAKGAEDQPRRKRKR